MLGAKNNQKSNLYRSKAREYASPGRGDDGTPPAGIEPIPLVREKWFAHTTLYIRGEGASADQWLLGFDWLSFL